MSKEKALKLLAKWQEQAECEEYVFLSLNDYQKEIVQKLVAQAYWNAMTLIDLNIPNEIPQFKDTRKELDNL
jgi:hypothetical protein